VPAIVAGFVILLAWYAHINIGIHGTLAILVLAAIFRFIPFSVRTISGGILSVSSELEEASSVSGATLTQTLRKVVTPLVSRQMLISAILTFTLVFRDAVTPLFLATGATMVLPLYIFYLWVTGYMEYAAAMITFQMLILLIITIIVMRFMGLEAFIKGR
jgi:ABC-type Fe3+ transport system permease subunit